MKEKYTEFVQAFINTMPQYAEFARSQIMGWIGYCDDNDFDFTPALDDGYSYDEYMKLYEELQIKISNKISGITLVKGLLTYQIPYGMTLLDESKCNSVINSISNFFIELENSKYDEIPKEDVDRFWALYNEMIGGDN